MMTEKEFEKVHAELIAKIKALRVSMDFWMINGYSKLKQSPYTMLALRSTQLTRMWLGKVLGELGTENPYPQSDNPKSDVVERATDLYEDDPKIHEDDFKDIFTGLAMVKRLRDLLGNIVEDELDDFDSKIWTYDSEGVNHFFDAGDVTRPLDIARQHLAEAQMWLGMELAAIDSFRKWVEAGKPPQEGVEPLPQY